MTGLKIALTGAVLFVVLTMFRSAARDSGDKKLTESFGLLAFISLLAIPTGLIYQIWSH